MQRTAVNPWEWMLKVGARFDAGETGINQAEIVEGQRRTLFCSGQSAMDAEGNPQHLGDMRGQVTLAMDNLDAVLKAADMTLANVVRFNIYTTDVDAFLACAPVIAERFAAAEVKPPGTLVGVTRLAFPELMVELEATAID